MLVNVISFTTHYEFVVSFLLLVFADDTYSMLSCVYFL